MCRNIKDLHNFDPPVTNEEVNLAALQFVRKITGSNKPSKANEAAFDKAVHDIAHTAGHLLESWTTNAAPRNREVEAERSRARTAARFGTT
jgi:hypothetical protein